MNLHRRTVLWSLAAMPLLLREALAKGDKPIRNGFHTLQGKVLLNEQPASLGGVVAPGDRISTGAKSMAVFVVERDAYLLRADSRMEIAQTSTGLRVLRVATGKMLSVFARGEKRIELPTATIGIRGTAAYVEAGQEMSYICTCYGTAEIQATADPNAREVVTTRHHDAPRYIYGKGAEKLIKVAPAINHTDAELIMLEDLVGRMPPFYNPWEGSGYYGK
jgi:hypothetical protein